MTRPIAIGRNAGAAPLRPAPPACRNIALAVTLVAAVVLAACGQRTPTPPPTPPHVGPLTATAPSPAAPTDSIVSSPTPPPTPLASPTPGQRVLTVGLAEMPGSLDPANALDRSALLITRHLYDGLTAFEPGGTRPVPALAVRWTASPDALEWTFELRPGVTFADGAPLTAQAVAANFERWLAAEPPGRYAFWRVVFGGFAREMDAEGEPLALIAEARAVGASTVVLTLNRPDATLPNSLAMPSFAIVNPTAFAGGAEGLEATSAGTGAYRLRAAPQPGLVRLERNPTHWRWAESGPTGPDELVFKVISDDTQRLLALQTGEIEAMTDIRPADYAAALAPDGPVRLVMDPALTVLYLGFNQARAPWGSPGCRLAVSAALDPARYAREFFPGDAEPARALLPPAVWGYVEPGEPPARDLAAAQERWQACLAAGAVAPAAVTLYVPPIPRPYLPDPAGLGAAVQADLAALGINVEIVSPEWETTWLPDVHSGRADLFLLGWSGINGDPDAFLCPLFCGLEGAFNSDGAGFPAPPDAELAQLLLEARTTVDPAGRERLYAQALERLSLTVPAKPLALRLEAWAFRAGVEGYTPSPIDSVFFAVTSPAWPASR